jgi:hypothetical protein
MATTAAVPLQLPEFILSGDRVLRPKNIPGQAAGVKTGKNRMALPEKMSPQAFI